MAWPTCKINQKGIWFCLAQQPQVERQHQPSGLVENTHRYGFTHGCSTKKGSVPLIVFWEGTWWIVTASAASWDRIKAIQAIGLCSRLHISQVLITSQPWRRSCPAGDIHLAVPWGAPRSAAFGFGHFFWFWPQWAMVYFCAITNLVCRAIGGEWLQDSFPQK